MWASQPAGGDPMQPGHVGGGRGDDEHAGIADGIRCRQDGKPTSTDLGKVIPAGRS